MSHRAPALPSIRYRGQPAGLQQSHKNTTCIRHAGADRRLGRHLKYLSFLSVCGAPLSESQL